MNLNNKKEEVEQFECMTCLCANCGVTNCNDCICCDGHHPIEGCKDFKKIDESEYNTNIKTDDNIFIKTMDDIINHPNHYVEGRKYEPIDVILDWELDFCLGNAIKYISRAGRKDKNKTVEDLEKARWYIDRAIQERTK